MYARRVRERTLTFDFAEGLVEDNLLLVDRETRSLWSQLVGGAVSGPLQGTTLETIPSIQTSWRHWRTRNPGTRVMIVPGEEGRPYFYRNRAPGAPRPAEPPTAHDTSALGLGLALDGETIWLPFTELERTAAPLTLSIASRTVIVHHVADAPTAWAEDAEGRLLDGVLAYRTGWLAFHPGSTVWSAGGAAP